MTTMTEDVTEAPAQAGASPSLGDRLTLEQMQALPTGARVRTRGGALFTRRADGRFTTARGTLRDADYMVERGAALLHLPEEVDQTSETPAGALTLEQYKHRFRTVVYGAQQRSAVSADPLDRAMEILEVPKPEPYVGMPVCLCDEHLIENLPDRTLLVVGKDPKIWRQYAVYAVIAQEAVLLVGGHDDCTRVATITSIPNVEEVPTFERSESELSEIRAFMKRAWEVGLKAKSENEWCGEYEAAMARAGITSSVVRGAPPADVLDASVVAELPEGTILRYYSGASGSVLYRRVDSSTNPARTVRIGGSLPGGWSSRGNEVVHRPAETMDIRINEHEEMAGMPVGTTVSERVSDAPRYVKGDDGLWRNGDYAYREDQFNINYMRYVVIP